MNYYAGASARVYDTDTFCGSLLVYCTCDCVHVSDRNLYAGAVLVEDSVLVYLLKSDAVCYWYSGWHPGGPNSRLWAKRMTRFCRASATERAWICSASHKIHLLCAHGVLKRLSSGFAMVDSQCTVRQQFHTLEYMQHILLTYLH